MTTAVETQRVVAQPQDDKDPIVFLIACGLLEPRGTIAGRLREILGAYLPLAESVSYSALQGARERIGKSLKPGETLAQLVIQMWEE